MYLIEIFIPLYDNKSGQFEQKLFLQTRTELLDQFGGLTVYSRVPVTGFWQKENTKVIKDDLLIYEIYTAKLDKTWWRNYRSLLEKRFLQDSIVIRLQNIELI